ncbi:hypothetical protein [Flavivirga jejuensis]|uniref:Uncharacterized protein n=1 Tax=Flavivirga jejuensis TaxID=870487 RepID=A0ABT8WHU1_9FLAO|nr:hypothetical protein [Flavivirga jejuensis]MDO5972719.1 hypothetical protein [Flavivirga jejuensis]
MKDISIICYNDFGITFRWKRCAVEDFNKVQLVFENIRLFLKQNELIQFSKNVELALERADPSKNNKAYDPLELFLLEGPNPQVSFAISYVELEKMQDLVCNTLFQLGLDRFLGKQKISYN